MSFASPVAFPSVAHFPASATFPGTPVVVGPVSVTNVEKLSYDLMTAIGTEVAVSDGFTVAGAVEALNCFNWPHGTFGGNPTYTSLNPTIVQNTGSDSAYYVGGAWNYTDGGDNTYVAATGNEDYPWQADWTLAGLTLTHPATQALTAASSSQAGVFIDVFGVAIKNGTEGGKDAFVLLPNNDTFNHIGGVAWGSGAARWEIYNAVGQITYYSESDVATPDLASNWKNASDDAPAPIVVSSVTAGALGAGLRIGDVTYIVNGNLNGRNVYSDVLEGEENIVWDTDHFWWKDVSGDNQFNLGNVAFPFLGSPEVSVTRDDVANESNWISA